MYFDKFKSKCELLGYKLYGMNEAEIQELAGEYNSLPKAYIELLSLVGHGTTAPYWNGQDSFGYSIPDLYNDAVMLLAENNEKISLKKTDFVFWMSQGVIFSFFNTEEGDDPPVYVYTEAIEGRFIKVSETLSGFIRNFCFAPQKAFSELKDVVISNCTDDNGNTILSDTMPR